MAGTLVTPVLVLAAGLNAFAIWTIHSHWRTRRGAPHFLLGLFPFAIMFLVAPVPLIVWQLIRDFQAVAVGGSTISTVMAVPARAFLPGAVAFIASMLAAAALQWHASWEDGADESTTAIRPATPWATTIVVTLPVVGLAVVGLGCLTQRMPRAIMERALLLLPSAGPPPFDPQQMSVRIASWLVLAFAGGLICTVAIATMGLLTLLLVRARRFSAAVNRYAWLMAVALLAFGVWNAWQDLTDLNWISTTPTASTVAPVHRGT